MKYRTKYFCRNTRDSSFRRRSAFYANDAYSKRGQGAYPNKDWGYYHIFSLKEPEEDEYGEVRNTAFSYVLEYLNNASKGTKAPCDPPAVSRRGESIVVTIKKDAKDFLNSIERFCDRYDLAFIEIPPSLKRTLLADKRPKTTIDSVKGSAPITYDQLQDFYDNKCRNPKEKRIVKDFIDDAYSDGYYDGKDETGWTWADLYESLGRRAVDDSVRSPQKKNKRWFD